ncbi:MAG: hypothetical protein M3256_06925 [Actinomycetota bacterium]|nr:hypothetical protein [Actinomycetota bacterium]
MTHTPQGHNDLTVQGGGDIDFNDLAISANDRRFVGPRQPEERDLALPMR